MKAGKGTTGDFLADQATDTDSDLEEQKIRIREGEGSSSFTQTQVADDGTRARLRADEVYAAEKRAAEDAIQRQEVPAGYREYIRRYFERIQPDRDDTD